jgi:arylsulfatase A-like enzyme
MKLLTGDEIATVTVTALSLGVFDVSVALLQQPRDFGTFAAMFPPIVATSLAVLAAFLVLRLIAGAVWPRARQNGRLTAVMAVSLAAALGLILLLGLHTAPATAHALFKASVVLLLAAFVGAGTYALHGLIAARDDVHRLCSALILAVPVASFEVLTYVWLQVYTIDSVQSFASVLASAALFVVLVITIALFVGLRRTNAPSRALATFAVLLVIAALSGRSDAAGQHVTAAGGSTPRSPRRIVLISIDTLRADAVSAASAGPTPEIAKLAAESLVFSNALAPSPWTLPSMVSMLTGLSPAVHLTTDVSSRVSDSAETLAERLARRGYYTAAVVHNDLLNPTSNLGQGFAEYESLHDPSYGSSAGATLLQFLLPALFPREPWPTSTDHTDKALEWLDEHADRDAFLWLHYRDPHAPFSPPREYVRGTPPDGLGFEFGGQELTMRGFVVPSAGERRWIRGLYDAEVRYIDAQIGRLVAALRRLDWYDDSLIVLTSDHGEEFWEHGAHGHGHSMYQELLRVPLIVKLPRSSRRGAVTTPVSIASVTPTVLDIASVPYEPATLSAPSLLQEDAGGMGPLMATAQILFDRREAVFVDQFKYIVSLIDGREQLFDLARDPDERESIATATPEALAAARAALSRQRAEAASLRKRIGILAGEQKFDADALRRLRSLGYLH